LSSRPAFCALSLPDALPILAEHQVDELQCLLRLLAGGGDAESLVGVHDVAVGVPGLHSVVDGHERHVGVLVVAGAAQRVCGRLEDRKSTRLNSSHVKTSYAV